ncbi:MAG: type IIL restriction-modification enzyme MmeI [Kiritimatiellales bacterium]
MTAQIRARIYEICGCGRDCETAGGNPAVDRLYRSKPFASDEERLGHLFKLYEEMTAKETLI